MSEATVMVFCVSEARVRVLSKCQKFNCVYYVLEATVMVLYECQNQMRTLYEWQLSQKGYECQRLQLGYTVNHRDNTVEIM